MFAADVSKQKRFVYNLGAFTCRKRERELCRETVGPGSSQVFCDSWGHSCKFAWEDLSSLCPRHPETQALCPSMGSGGKRETTV